MNGKRKCHVLILTGPLNIGVSAFTSVTYALQVCQLGEPNWIFELREYEPRRLGPGRLATGQMGFVVDPQRRLRGTAI
jgi:hypothetical protein